MILFDTSVFIAGLISTHIHHLPSLAALKNVQDKTVSGAMCMHSLAECYSILTTYPISPLISPEGAETLIWENIVDSFQVIELKAVDYRAAVKRLTSKNLRGGAVYDALVFQAALMKKIKTIYTWNLKHFTRLADGEIEILQPF